MLALTQYALNNWPHIDKSMKFQAKKSIPPFPRANEICAKARQFAGFVSF